MVTFGAAADGDDDEFLDQQPDQGDESMSDDGDEDYFTSDDDDDYWSTQGNEDDFMSDNDDDDEEEEDTSPVDAPPVAVSEAAIAALEAADAPADDCCPVCLQDGGDAPEPAAARPWSRVTACGHRFHAACLEKWMKVKLSCPVCRCPAAPAAACRRDAAPPEPAPPFPEIVEEFLVVGYEESFVFDYTARWMEYIDGRHPEYFPVAGAA